MKHPPALPEAETPETGNKERLFNPPPASGPVAPDTEKVPIVHVVKPTVVQPAIIARTPVSASEVETKPEEKTSAPHDSEEKASNQKKKLLNPEEKASGGNKKRKFRYEGEGGRIHTEAQIDEILDFWLMTGELPTYVSDRQRYDYRHHERLPERKELLEQRGISIVVTIPGTTGRVKNVIPIKGASAQRKTGSGA